MRAVFQHAQASQSYDEKADVFSFAINLWELATRRVPYAGMSSAEIVQAVTERGYRPSLEHVDPGCPPSLLALIEWCWQQDPSERPPFGAVIRKLTKISREFQRASYAPVGSKR